MVTEGSIQFVVGDEVRTVRSGYSMVAPPGVAHRVVTTRGWRLGCWSSLLPMTWGRRFWTRYG